MTNSQEYPLLEKLNAIKRASGKTNDEKVKDILEVLKEEVRFLKKDEKIHLRWDVARAVFDSTTVNKAIFLEELKITVQDTYNDCILMNNPVMYKQSAMLFYGFYSESHGNNLSNKENNEVILSVFADKEKELYDGFEKFLVPHIFKMLNFKNTSMTPEEQEQWTKSLINKYRKDYDGSFFFKYVEAVISEFESKKG